MALYARMDWLFLTRDPASFLMWNVSDVVLSIASVAAMFLLAARFSGIGAWSQPQIVFMLGYAALVEGLVNLFFGYNVSFISRRLGRGQLDHTLIQPQPLWMSLIDGGIQPGLRAADNDAGRRNDWMGSVQTCTILIMRTGSLCSSTTWHSPEPGFCLVSSPGAVSLSGRRGPQKRSTLQPTRCWLASSAIRWADSRPLCERDY